MKNCRLNGCRIACIVLPVVFSCGCIAITARTTETEAAPDSGSVSRSTSKPATLASGVYNFNDLVVKSSDFGDQRTVFRSPTATLDELEIHMTTLKPGQRPHAPHQHPYEEMVILKQGTLEATINDRVFSMTAGSVLFVAPNDLHGWRNSGTTPAEYIILTWKTPRTGAEK